MDASAIKLKAGGSRFLTLFHLSRGGLFVLSGSPGVSSFAQNLLLAPLSRGHQITILDAGNSFDPYIISRAAHGRVPSELLSRVLVSRSFTCHQTYALVRKVLSQGEKASSIIAVLGLLTTFYDEEVPLGERRGLLRKTLAVLKELSQKGKKVFIVSTDAPPGARDRFDSLVAEAADEVLRVELSGTGSSNKRPIAGVNGERVARTGGGHGPDSPIIQPKDPGHRRGVEEVSKGFTKRRPGDPR